MKRLLTTVLCLYNLTAFAQRWEPHVGLNFGPLLSRSLEATYELTTPDRNGAVFGNVGYTFERAKTQYGEPQLGLYVREFNQRANGAFLKAGGKFFINPRGVVKGFFGMLGVASHFQNANRVVIEFVPDLPIPTRPEEKSFITEGWQFAVGAVTGANVRINTRCDVDLGLQITRPLDEDFDDVVGRKTVYFRPGIGPGGREVAFQAILAVKYRLRP